MSLKIAFIRARWHSEIVDQALLGFEGRCQEIGLDQPCEVFDVPGAFEMPFLAMQLAQTGNYCAIVAAALVVDGGIYRHDFVASAVVDGLMQAQMDTGVPVFSVSLTPHHFQPTDYHQSIFKTHFVEKGSEAADAVKLQLQTLQSV